MEVERMGSQWGGGGVELFGIGLRGDFQCCGFSWK